MTEEPTFFQPGPLVLDPNTGLPVGVGVCQTCFAIVAIPDFSQHGQWHLTGSG